MLVRCPNGNHSIELDDDLIGARVRCQKCGFVFFVNEADRESGSTQVQSKPPIATPGIDKENANLAERIYDGLPPLSVMLALRRQNGRYDDADGLDVRAQMTPDDWKALDAYESVLRASFGLRTSLIVGAIPLALNLLFFGILFFGWTRPHLSRGELGAIPLIATFVLLLCYPVLLLGSWKLQIIRKNFLFDYLLVITCCAALAFGLITAIEFVWFGVNLAFFVGIGASANLIAAFNFGKTAFRIFRALQQIEPPEITNRLSEALMYLDQIEEPGAHAPE